MNLLKLRHKVKRYYMNRRRETEKKCMFYVWVLIYIGKGEDPKNMQRKKKLDA